MRYYIFRNNTLEPLFGNLDARYSGYGDISSLEEEADRYIWFYQVPFGFDRSRIAEEVLSYIDKLRWVIEKIPAHKSVLVFSLVDLCPFQWAGSEWEVQESIESYNRSLRSLALDRAGVEARPVWKPMHRQPVYKDAPAYVNGVSEAIFKVGMCLPAGPYVTDEDVAYIVDCIKKNIL